MTNTSTGFITKKTKVNGKEINYIVYIPRNYDPSTPMPTIVFLNGMGECGTDGLQQIRAGLGPNIMLNPDKWPFIVVFPQKQETYAQWEDEDDMVLAILDKTRQEYNVDSSRIYLTGISQGGHGTWTIGSLHPEIFAAIAPVCGYRTEWIIKVWADNEAAIWINPEMEQEFGENVLVERLKNTPIWAFHGVADETVPVGESVELCESITAVNGDCKLTLYPEVGHNSWDRAYREEDLPGWLLEHRK